MIIIFSIHNKTKFLETQIQSFKKNIINEYKHIIINNAPTEDLELEINKICEKHQTQYIRASCFLSDVSHIVANILNNIKQYNYEFEESNYYAVIESDIFCYKKINILDFILDCDIAGIYQQRDNFQIEYLHPCFFITKNKKIFDSLDWSLLPGTDTGGATHHSIKDNNYSINWLNHTAFLNTEEEAKVFEKNYDKEYGVQIIESSFIHYNRGSGWYHGDSHNLHEKKIEWVVNFLKDPKINEKKLKIFQTTFSHSFKYYNGLLNNYFKTKLNPLYNV